ncbi:MAG: endonuclease/exonuclease/phosphatase family protein [Acetobacter sp.]|nr:endonuclease/exonuclease/phosphatase family protein [Acetobacter sp.]
MRHALARLVGELTWQPFWTARRHAYRRQITRQIFKPQSGNQSDQNNPKEKKKHFKVISWNLLHRTGGASVHDVTALIRHECPDILLMQEAKSELDILPDLIGGFYARAPLPGRVHGIACWSLIPFERPSRTCPIPSGVLVKRHVQIIEFASFSLANVHLSHGQVLNRRQLRRIAAILPAPCAILGDFNLVGPTLLPDFADVGPQTPTHRMAHVVPIRIDRCLVRGMACFSAETLAASVSDHRPISVTLTPQEP